MIGEKSVGTQLQNCIGHEQARRILGPRKTLVQQSDERRPTRMISHAIQVRVVLDPVSPELSSVANDSLQQVKSRVAFSEVTVNTGNVV